MERRGALVVEVATDEGVTGWGEALCHGLQPPEIVASFVQHVCGPMLVGRDPFDVEVLWEEVYNRTRPFGGGSRVNAISGVDVALWDAVGRLVGQPVHKLLGGAFRREVAPSATGFYRREGEDPVGAGVREASQRLAEGFRAMKLKVGFGVEADIEYVRAVCEAVGPEVRLLMDANCAYDAPAARRVLFGVEGAGSTSSRSL